MFGKKKEEMMVYVVMGFLEAGKTSLIRDLIVDDMFDVRLRHLFLHVRKVRKNLRRLTLKKDVLYANILRMRTLLTEKLSKNS